MASPPRSSAAAYSPPPYPSAARLADSQCYPQYSASLKCLEECNQDKSKCQQQFDNYKECKKKEVYTKHSAEVFKHLDKQGQALMEAYRTMSHELHRLQIGEDIPMQKLYELMLAEGLLKKKEKLMI